MKLKVIAISVICLILSLSILDAPEYVRCTDIGICEFLEIHGHLDNILTSDIICHISHVISNNFFPMLEGIINSKERIQNLICFSNPAILNFPEISCNLIKSQDPDLAKKIPVPCLKESKSIEQNLKIVKISVIRS